MFNSFKNIKKKAADMAKYTQELAKDVKNK